MRGYQPGRAALDRVEQLICALDDARNRRTINQEPNQPSHTADTRFPIATTPPAPGASVSTTPEPDPHTTNRGQQPSRRLNRVQQFTLATWRHASDSVGRHVLPNDILAHVAMQAVLAALRDTSDPLHLFVRHQHGEAEIA